MRSSVGEFLHGSVVDTAEVNRVRDAILFEGPEKNKRIVRFFFLLVFAAAIATFGLLGDSVAVVIGAMIIAPLMMPIMGLAFSVSIGDRQAIGRSFAISIGGIIVAIMVGYLLSFLSVDLLQVENINQVMVRTSPRLLDLSAAIFTGLAGAFAMSRRDVSDTLPGVAIAISLVPPLANVGILLSAGRADLALGSLLLFLTNYCAIVLTGAFLFGLMGFPAVDRQNRSLKAKKRAILIALIGFVIICIPLSYTSYQIVTDNLVKARIHAVSDLWLAGSGYRMVAVNTERYDKMIEVTLLGEGDLPSLESLRELTGNGVQKRPVILEIIAKETIILEPGSQ